MYTDQTVKLVENCNTGDIGCKFRVLNEAKLFREERIPYSIAVFVGCLRE